MKRNIYLLVITVITLAIIAVTLKNNNPNNVYSPRVKNIQGISGYQSYLKTIRANQNTGFVSNQEVHEVIDDINNQNSLKFKSDWPLKWEFRGPDNIGGRTRCLVIDKENSSILYTGGVSGSVFKSTNGGGSWFPLTLGDDNFGVVSMAQTNDGKLFYGTGENGLLLSNPNGNEGSGFNGMGIYRSTDGETFNALSNTSSFGNVFVLTAHPTTNHIYAGSSNGLRVSEDGGDTWKLIRGGSCRDMKFNKNGVLIASIGNTIWRSSNPNDGSSYQSITGFTNNGRAAIAWAESDDNYCYIVTVGTVQFDGQTYGGGSLTGLYRSTDAGQTFTQEVGQMSQFFAPFTYIGLQAQGLYDIALGVHPRNKDRVFIGGVLFAEWSLQDGPKIVGNTFNSPRNPYGIHSDKHLITFDNTGEDPIMYICSDGGVARTTTPELDQYKNISTNLGTTQFFGIAADVRGRILGGTQDNNTLLITGESYPRKIAESVISGDGFECAISAYNPNYMFGESQYGNLRRSITAGSSFESMWDNRISSSFASAQRPTGYFNNPFTLWENPAVIESIETFGRRTSDDSIANARIFFATNDGIWMCKNAYGKPHDPTGPKEGSIRWFRVSNLRRVHYMKPSKDGESLFVTTNSGRIYRVDNLLTTQFDTISLPTNNQIAANLTTTEISQGMGLSSSRTVTSIAIDPENPNRMVATAGNYGNTNYVYISENAMDASPTWTSIQGNLPRFPVYHALISIKNPDVIILGTEFGIWATNNGRSANPTWAEAADGIDSDMPFPKVPVFDLVQIESNSSTGPRIYAGTHGMGIWETKSMLTSVRPNNNNPDTRIINAYPNPANSFVNIDAEIKGSYSLKVYSLTGNIVYQTKGSNSKTIQISTSEWKSGNYFVEILGNNTKITSKIIVQH